jgi:hypothetical protein
MHTEGILLEVAMKGQTGPEVRELVRDDPGLHVPVVHMAPPALKA